MIVWKMSVFLAVSLNGTFELTRVLILRTFCDVLARNYAKTFFLFNIDFWPLVFVFCYETIILLRLVFEKSALISFLLLMSKFTITEDFILLLHLVPMIPTVFVLPFSVLLWVFLVVHFLSRSIICLCLSGVVALFILVSSTYLMAVLITCLLRSSFLGFAQIVFSSLLSIEEFLVFEPILTLNILSNVLFVLRWFRDTL